MNTLSTYVQNPIILVVLVVWELVWKGLALWQSARKGQKYWFIPLLVVNSAGLLPIIYLVGSKYLAAKKG
jgi:hypothetical protein